MRPTPLKPKTQKQLYNQEVDKLKNYHESNDQPPLPLPSLFPPEFPSPKPPNPPVPPDPPSENAEIRKYSEPILPNPNSGRPKSLNMGLTLEFDGKQQKWHVEQLLTDLIRIGFVGIVKLKVAFLEEYKNRDTNGDARVSEMGCGAIISELLTASLRCEEQRSCRPLKRQLGGFRQYGEGGVLQSGVKSQQGDVSIMI